MEIQRELTDYIIELREKIDRQDEQLKGDMK